MSTLNKALLDILVCPLTHGALQFKPERQELWSRGARLAFPVREGVPVLLEEEARPLSQDELDAA